MVKKPAPNTPSLASLVDSELATAVKESAQQIWLAGMGAFAKAQAEGGKVFEALVKEGASLQRKTQAAAEERLGDVTGRVSSIASEVTSKAGASWDKLENIFEERTAKALGKLGVPTAKDVAELTRRVDELAAALARLSTPPEAAPAKAAARARAAKPPKTPAAATTAAPARKAAARRAPARKPATDAA